MKYAPLWNYLERQTGAELELNFAAIEALIGAPLPASAEQAWWWGGLRGPDPAQPRNEAWRKAWPAAGYEATLIRGAQTVKFRRIDAASHGAACKISLLDQR